MAASKKPGYDEWADMGKELYNTVAFCKTLDPYDVYSILIMGKEGTGKTVGISHLDPTETYYVNADKKPLSFPGWRKMYKKGKIAEGGNYTDSVEDYDDVRTLIETVYDNRKDDGPFVVFYLAHVEDYKSVNGLVAQKLKTLGKLASKQNIEGSVIHAYYTDVDLNKQLMDTTRYRFRTVSTGYDTARSTLGYWDEPYIPNNAQLIIDKIVEKEY